MRNILSIFFVFVIYPMTVSAEETTIDTSLFDELPIKQAEVNSVSRVFWSAQSIQDKIKESIPDTHRARFTRADGCDIKAVTKTEGSADTCDLNDDPSKNAKFIYNFNVSCSFGSYQIAICSRQEAKLLNQLKVNNPEKLVSDDNPFDLDSTM